MLSFPFKVEFPDSRLSLPPTPVKLPIMRVAVQIVYYLDCDRYRAPLFRNFKFEKSAVIPTGYMAIAGYFFG